MRAKEFQPKKLVIFDIDDTLVHTQTKVHVVKDGQVTKELNSHEFTHYKLQPGEQFDFENFRNAHDFFHKSKPIIPMMNQLKQDIATGNKVVMVTARADFDDRELFLDTFRKYGVDMAKVHVYRAGNMQGKIQTEEKKKIIIRNLLDKGNYTKAIMYDDAVPNLESFVELKDEYQKTKFYAWHVSLEGEAREYKRTDENFANSAEAYRAHLIKTLPQIIKLFANIGKGWIPSKDEMLSAVDNAYQVMKHTGDAKQAGKALMDELNTLHRMSQGKKGIDENFANGKKPGRKGLAKRSGVNTKASVSSLRKTAKNSSGEKARMAHWLANMKAGRAKKNK